MKFHCIIPSGLVGTCYFENKDGQLSHPNFSDQILVLEFKGNTSQNLNLFCNAGYYLVSNSLKEEMVSSQYSGCHFKFCNKVMDDQGIPVEKVFWLLMQHPDFSDLSFQNVEKNMDFNLFENHLIISDIALEKLRSFGAFQDEYEGENLGENYRFLDNRYTFDCSIAEFISEKMPILIRDKILKRRLVFAKYRELEGLPPLV
jgi:hypothetical protein